MQDEGRRFTLSDPWRDPWALFPSFMQEMFLRYPDYLLAYDRDQEKWVILHELSGTCRRVVSYVQFGDGVPAVPSVEILNRLSECEVLRRFCSLDEFCRWVEKEAERRYEEGTAALQDELAYAARPYINYVTRGGPESVVIRPMRPEERAQTEDDLARSIPGSTTPGQEAA